MQIDSAVTDEATMINLLTCSLFFVSVLVAG
jgi:hypothetical protein